jgi:hypothetical protein
MKFLVSRTKVRNPYFKRLVEVDNPNSKKCQEDDLTTVKSRV